MAATANRSRILPAIGRRGHARVRLGIPARLLLQEGLRQCRVLNLSVSGAMLGIAPTPTMGDCGILQFPRINVFCSVIWTDTERCGVEFVEPLGLDTVKAICQLASDNPNLEAEL